MDLNIAGRHALITGASKGLGLACAQSLANEDVNVNIAARGESALADALEKISSGNDQIQSFASAADMASAEDIDRTYQEARQNLGDIDILIANAGGPPAGFFAGFGDDDWLKAHELTMMSTVRLIKHVLPAMKKNRWGRIIVITSVAARQPIPNLVLSNTMRAGIHGLVKTLAREYAADGITINGVMPGLTRTDRLENLAKNQAESSGDSPEAELEKMGQNVPIGRIATPKEFADVVAFLCSDLASYVTGVSLPVDGGLISGNF